MLYICATPIGNLQDISLRAIEVLSTADIIVCEDTRVTRVLLNAHGIRYNKLLTLHEYNEQELTNQIIELLTQGKAIVQVTDAGTPGISDPGARLCNRVLAAGFKIVPIPGACAYITLLSIAGINHQSLFFGFLPATRAKRLKILELWSDVEYTVCIYEAPHRIIDCVTDIVDVLGKNRVLVMGRELTKQFETIKKSSAAELLDYITTDPNQQRGEFVILILPQLRHKDNNSLDLQAKKTAKLLLAELPPKKVAQLVSKIHQVAKDEVYNYLINLG
jgi:16S rRNA (cytidine1402-2'-O)-methyltransferase